jgi:aspartate/glutamate racemase
LFLIRIRGQQQCPAKSLRRKLGPAAILLGCTEIDLLVGPDDAPKPVFDTTRLHAERAVEMALEPLRTR